MQQQPVPIPPNTQLTVILEAQEWNVVFGGLNELPMRVSRQVFDKIMEQVQQQQQQEQMRPPSPPPTMPHRPNGEDGPPPYHRSNA